MNKVRHVNYSPDEYLVGIAGMTPEEQGIYWLVCTLIYSTGGPIDEDDQRLRALSGCHGARRKSILARLIEGGKLVRKGREITQKRSENELENARKRSENGRDNVAHRWKINGVAPEVVIPGANANHQPPTTNHKDTPPKAPPGGRAARFAEFWAAYPHKVGKGAAERAFKTHADAVPIAELIEAVRRYIADKPADRNYCNPSTWLNQRRWEDEPDAVTEPRGDTYARPTGPPPKPEPAADRPLL